MLPSPTLFRAWGIPVKLHWSLLILLPMVLGIEPPSARWFTLAVLPAGFLCILLHEFGHALVAQKKGLRVQDIYLHPVGGLARIAGMPEDPIDELQVAVGGPLVTLALAVVLAPLTVVLALLGAGYAASWCGALAFLNVLWFFFNLIPAYPMDGGRVLKAWWTPKLGRLEAARRSGVWGRTIGWIMVVLGVLLGHWGLGIIGVFVVVTSTGEYRLLLQRQHLQERFGWGTGEPVSAPGDEPVDFRVGPAPYEAESAQPSSRAKGFFSGILATAPLLWNAARKPRLRWGG